MIDDLIISKNNLNKRNINIFTDKILMEQRVFSLNFTLHKWTEANKNTTTKGDK